MLTYNSNGDMEWSGDGENTDYSTTSSNSSRRNNHGQDHDSLSDEDDLSDEFSLVDSDDERRGDLRFTQQIIQVSLLSCCNFDYILIFD